MWQGDVASGAVGSAERKMIALGGPGVRSVSYLLDLAMVLDLPIICNQKMSGLLHDRVAARQVDVVLYPHNPVPEKVFAVEDAPPLEEDPLSAALQLLNERQYEAALNKFRSHQLKHPDDRHAARWVTNISDIQSLPPQGYARRIGTPQVDLNSLERAEALADWRQEK